MHEVHMLSSLNGMFLFCFVFFFISVGTTNKKIGMIVSIFYVNTLGPFIIQIISIILLVYTDVLESLVTHDFTNFLAFSL